MKKLLLIPLGSYVVLFVWAASGLFSDEPYLPWSWFVLFFVTIVVRLVVRWLIE